MLTHGNHRDTYVEEYHRGFFTRYAMGKPPRKCAIEDEHVGLTHAHANVRRAADTLARLLFSPEESE